MTCYEQCKVMAQLMGVRLVSTLPIVFDLTGTQIVLPEPPRHNGHYRAGNIVYFQWDDALDALQHAERITF